MENYVGVLSLLSRSWLPRRSRWAKHPGHRADSAAPTMPTLAPVFTTTTIENSRTSRRALAESQPDPVKLAAD